MKSWSFALVMIFLFAILTGCGFDAPTCTEMAIPIQISPPRGSTEGHMPVFIWSYPTSECAPDRFHLVVSRIYGNPDSFGEEYHFLDTWISAEPEVTAVHLDGTSNYLYRFTPAMEIIEEPQDVFPAGIYYWRVTPYNGDFRGESTDWRFFQIYGVNCEEAVYSSIDPIYPFDGQTVIGNRTTFIWLENNPCGSFRGGIAPYYLEAIRNGNPDDEVPLWASFETFARDIELDYCTRYDWWIRTTEPDYETTGYYHLEIIDAFHSETFTFTTTGPEGTDCEADETPLLKPEAPQTQPMAEILENANCRSGPNLQYPVMDTLPSGGLYVILGMDQQGEAWLLMDARIEHECWVDADLVRVIGETGALEVIDPGAPPEDNPLDAIFNQPQGVDCSVYNQNPVQCENDPACWWDSSVAPNGTCESN